MLGYEAISEEAISALVVIVVDSQTEFWGELRFV